MRYKCPVINRLRVNGDKAREGSWRVGASLLKSDLALADMQNARGQCKVQDLIRGKSIHSGTIT